MYTIQQMQGLDYLLKRITSNPDYPFSKENLRLVIEYKGNLWTGDFLNYEQKTVSQQYIDGMRDIEKNTYSVNNSSLLSSVWEAYVKKTKITDYLNDPFRRIKDIPILFNTLLEILDEADIKDEDTFYPYLLNASTLDKSISLPLLNLKDERIKLVSIIKL